MKNTSLLFDEVIEKCLNIYKSKMSDYGSAWRILRLSSLTDQVFIKAQRIRSLQIKKISKVDEGQESEFIGIINYCIMALIQLEKGVVDEPDLNLAEAIIEYNKHIKVVKDLMMDKNHDYGEAWRDMRISSLTDLFTLFGVITVIFFLFKVLPGDPARMMMDQNENEEQLTIIKKKYGFDKPVIIQYLYYLNDLSVVSIYSNNQDDFIFLDNKKYSYQKIFNIGNYSIVLKIPYLRESYQRKGVKVSTIILNTFPNTVVLAISSILIAVIIGILLGIFSALKKDSVIDNIIQMLSTLGMSVPSFLSAIIAAWIFGYLLSDITGLNMTGSLYELDDYGENYELKLKNLILPSLVLGIRPIAVISMMMRNSLIDVLKKNYVITAYAKGLTTFQVITRHCLKNSLNPVVTALSGWFASLLAGSVFVEYIFGWNGLGKEIVYSLNMLDVPVIIGSVIVISFSFIMINIFVDEIYKILDPRITSL